MKYIMQLFSVGLMVFLMFPSNAQQEPGQMEAKDAMMAAADTTTFMVYGNCGMCKRRIEGALSELEGVHSAVWNRDTKMVSVSYDAAAISVKDMKKIIAAVGHDTDDFRAKDKVYNDLPGCCQYERPKS